MKKQLCLFILGLSLLAGCIDGTTAAAAADGQQTAQTQDNFPSAIRGQKQLRNLHKLNPNNYSLSFQKQAFINDTMNLKLNGDLRNCTVSYKSSKPSVLNVQKISENSCQYTGLSSGSATIQIKIRSEKKLFFQDKSITLKAKIVVSPKAVSIKFRRAKIKMNVGQKKKLKSLVVIRPSITKEKPDWESSDSDIAYFQNETHLYAKRPGTTYITASISNGMKVRCKVVVKKRKGKNKNTWD